MTYKNIKVGELTNKDSDVLKKLFNRKPKKITMQDIINQTEIKSIKYNLEW